MYVSDYGYATSGGNNKSKTECLSNKLFQWNTNDLNDCYNNNWLFNSKNAQWTNVPCAYTNHSSTGFIIGSYGDVNLFNNNNAFEILPTLYLKSNVQITSGEGTIENSYKLELIGE